jgi:signal transduction histidine kinase
MLPTLTESEAPSLPLGHYLVDRTGCVIQFTPACGKRDTNGSSNGFDISDEFSALTLPRQVAEFVRRDANWTSLGGAGRLLLANNREMNTFPISLDGAKMLALVVTEIPVPKPRSGQFLSGGLSARQLSALLTTAKTIHTGQTIQRVFQSLAVEASSLIQFDRASITLFREDTREVQVFALDEKTESDLRVGSSVPAENTVTAWVVDSGQPLVLPDITRESRFVIYPEMVRSGYRSVLCYPLMIEGKTIGTLNFTSRTPNQYPGEIISVIAPLAEQAAVAILNTRLREKLEAESRRFKRIIEVGNSVKHHLGPETGMLVAPTILRQICETACDLGWERAVILLRETADKGAYSNYIGAYHGEFSEHQMSELDQKSTHRMPVEGFSTTPGARQSGIHRRIGDHSFILGPSANSPLRKWHPEEFLVIPLAHEGKLYGTLSVDRTRVKSIPTDSDVEPLEMLADQATIVLYNWRLIEQLRTQLDEVNTLREQERLRTDQLQRTERLRALGELASGVAHNFNNALTIIQGRVGLLRMRQNDDQTRQALELIHQVALDAGNIVRRIQDFAKVRLDNTDFVTIELNELIREVAEVTRPRWKDEAESIGRKISVECLTNGFAYTNGNPTELREVLTNLIFNSVDAMPEGGKIVLSLQKSESEVCLSISDTGTGIPEEIRPRIFDPFFSTKGGLGTGMGLSVSHNIITRHEGRIWAEDGPAGGTVFHIALPSAAPQLQPERIGPPSLQFARPLRILVIDDEIAVGEFIREILGELGHFAVFQSSPREALNLLQSEVFEAIFTDLGMPEMSGWQFISEARKTHPDTPVVLVSGWANTLNKEELRAQSIRSLSKPVDLGELQAILKEISREMQ